MLFFHRRRYGYVEVESFSLTTSPVMRCSNTNNYQNCLMQWTLWQHAMEGNHSLTRCLLRFRWINLCVLLFSFFPVLVFFCLQPTHYFFYFNLPEMNVRKEEEEHSAEDKLKSQKKIYDGYIMQIANMVIYTLCTVQSINTNQIILYN